MTTRPFLSIKDAAAYLGVDYKTVYRLVRSGDLPAGKIGGVYRIRHEDLERFFERQKQAAGAGDWQPAEVADVMKCGRCLRIILDEDQIGGACQHNGCEELLCQTCWEAQPDRLCEAHRPGEAEALAVARARLHAGEIPLLVTALEARQRELAFVARFDRKVREIASLRHPLDGKVYRIAEWDRLRTATDETATLMDLLRVGYLDKRLTDRLPLNVALRFGVGTQPDRLVLRLEARLCAHLAAYARDGFDTQPAALNDLLPLLNELSAEAESGKLAAIIGLASPTGWDKAAIDYVSASPRGTSFTHRWLMPCLIDLQHGLLAYNALDDRLKPFVGLFSPLLPEEEVERVRQWIVDALLLRESLSLAEIAREAVTSEEYARQAGERLAQTGQYLVEEIERVGWVITPGLNNRTAQ